MSLIPIVIALKMLSTTSWDGIYKSLSGLILVFTALYGLIGALFLLTKIENSLDDNLKSLKNNIKVLYKIMFMLIALTIPIKILSTIKWNELSKAIISMLSVLTLLIGALKIMSLISSGSGGSEYVSTLSGIATSIKTIATALVLASSCILIFAAALYILSKIDSEKIADVLLAFVKVIPAILQTIIDYLPLIGKVILAAISMLIEVVIGAIPLIVSALMTLILNVLSSLAEHAYEIGVYLLRIILEILDALSEFIPNIVNKLHEIILKINQAIIEFIPKLIIDIFTLVAKVFRALVDSIILLVQEIIDSVKEINSEMFLELIEAIGLISILLTELSLVVILLPSGIAGAIGLISFLPYIAAIYSLIGSINLIPLEINLQIWKDILDSINYISEIMLAIIPSIALLPSAILGALALVTFLGFLAGIYSLMGAINLIPLRINVQIWKDILDSIVYILEIMLALIPYIALVRFGELGALCLIDFLIYLTPTLALLSLITSLGLSIDTKVLTDFANALKPVIAICIEFSSLLPFATLGKAGAIAFITFIPFLLVVAECIKEVCNILTKDVMNIKSEIFREFSEILEYIIKICIEISAMLVLATLGKAGAIAFITFIPFLLVVAECIKLLYIVLTKNSINSEPFKAFIEILGYVALICIEIISVSVLASIATASTGAIFIFMAGLNILILWLYSLQKIINNLSTKSFMNFATILGALLLICTEISILMPFAVLGFYGTIMLNTLLPSLMLTGVCLKGLQSAINGFDSNIFMAFANVLGALLLICMALTPILPFAILGFYGTIMLNTLLPSLMLTGVFLKGLQLSVNGLDSNIFIEFYEVLKICKQIFSILNGLSFNLFGTLIAINNLKILLPKLGTVLSDFCTLFSTDSKDSVNNIKILCEAIDNLIDILNKAKTKTFGNAKKLTDQLLDFYKKVNNMEIPQFDVISKFEDYAKSIRICVDLCQDIPDDYSNGKIKNLTIFIKDMFDCLSNLYLLLNMEIPQFDVISKFEDYAKSIRICVDLCTDIPDDIPDNYSNDKIKNLIFFIEDIFDCLSNLYLLLNKDLDKNIFNTIKMDTSKFKKMIIDLSSVVNELVYMYSNIQNNLDENKLNTILDTLFNSLQRFIDNVNSLDGIDKATEKLKSLKDCLKIAMEIAQNDIGNYTPTIRPVVDLNGVRNGIRNMNNMFDINPSVGLSTNSANQINSMMNANLDNSNNDLISLVRDINNKMDNDSGDVYNINGITYDDGSAVQDAIKTILRAAKIQGRI